MDGRSRRTDFGGAGPFLSILLIVLVVCMAFGWAFG
jgi:hypothetical protein